MSRNVEIKANLYDRQRVEELLGGTEAFSSGTFEQHDTFFAVNSGRLKLRMLPDTSELIYYERPDETGPKLSDYRICNVSEPEVFREMLSSALGIVGEVRKKRTLYLLGQTRVHIDQVEGLGDFIELEVVLELDQSDEDGREIAENLIDLLGINDDDLIDCAYIDLLRASAHGAQVSQ
jgi:predicted adenylyl cyclase CyaB